MPRLSSSSRISTLSVFECRLFRASVWPPPVNRRNCATWSASTLIMVFIFGKKQISDKFKKEFKTMKHITSIELASWLVSLFFGLFFFEFFLRILLSRLRYFFKTVQPGQKYSYFGKNLKQPLRRDPSNETPHTRSWGSLVFPFEPFFRGPDFQIDFWNLLCVRYNRVKIFSISPIFTISCTSILSKYFSSSVPKTPDSSDF